MKMEGWQNVRISMMKATMRETISLSTPIK